MGIFKKIKNSKAFQQIMKVAPLVGTALGGPFAGTALAIVGKALGIDATEAALEQELANNPDALLKLKQAEYDFKIKMEEIGITEQDLHSQDRDSARDMHIALKDGTPKWLAFYALTIFTAIVGYLCYTMYAGIPIDATLEKFLWLILGTVGGWVTQVFNFNFGSSRGSLVKTVEQTDAMRSYMSR